MLINLKDVFTKNENEKQLKFSFDLSEENVNPDAIFISPVSVQVNLVQDRQITVSLLIKARAECTCARCLKLFLKDFDVLQEFVISSSMLTHLMEEIPISSDMTLDIKQLVIQELSLEIPQVLVCSDDCKGLCPICARPKEENCDCNTEVIDPRLAVLKQLLSEENDD